MASPSSRDATLAVLPMARSVWITGSTTVAETGRICQSLKAVAVLVIAITAKGSSTRTLNVACNLCPGASVQPEAKSGGALVSPSGS